jgi:hypothetical protein
MQEKNFRKLLVSMFFVALLTFGLALPARAEIVVNDSIPYLFVVGNPCTGEPVLLSGTLHRLVHVTTDENGGFHFYSHFQPMGISGEGLLSGRKYHGTGGTINMTNDSSGPHVEDSFVNNFKIVGQGPGGNWMVHTNTHFTIDANGNITTNIVNTSAECR